MQRILVGVGSFLLPLAVACSSSAPAPEGPAPFEPVGTYDFTLTLGEDRVPGTLEIVRTATGLDSEATVEGETHAALGDSARVNGSHVVLFMTGGGDPVTFDLQFDGPTFTGEVITSGMDAMALAITGRRRDR